MKEPHKAKLVKDNITKLYLNIAGKDINMKKVTQAMKTIVDKQFPGKKYLEKALTRNYRDVLKATAAKAQQTRNNN